MLPVEIREVLDGTRQWSVTQGDCRDLLKLLPDNCIDAVVVDLPYELGFMGRDWDSSGIAFDAGMWSEVFRVLKPGAHVLSFGGTRTYHRMACAIEDAGFQFRDQIDWFYGQGMPKGQNISKAIDKKAGAVREIVGRKIDAKTGKPMSNKQARRGSDGVTDGWKRPSNAGEHSQNLSASITAPATEAAQQWDGWGTGLKPGHEPIAMAMKPLDGTFEANIRKWGVGAINVNACRLPGAPPSVPQPSFNSPTGAIFDMKTGTGRNGEMSHATGRWPANVIFSHAPECECIGTRRVKAAPPWNDNRPDSLFTGSETSPVHHSDGDGFETVDDWRCAPWCPVGMLDGQSGERTSGAWDGHRNASKHQAVFGSFQGSPQEQPRERNAGGAARYFTTFPFEPFFYEPKASQAEREKGVEWMPDEVVDDGRHTQNDTPYQRGKKKRKNTHATVKPVEVVRWCTRLVTPRGGVCLDMTCGSGTGGIAALAEGCRWIGLELIAKHVEISRARITGDNPLFNRTAGGSK